MARARAQRMARWRCGSEAMRVTVAVAAAAGGAAGGAAKWALSECRRSGKDAAAREDVEGSAEGGGERMSVTRGRSMARGASH